MQLEQVFNGINQSHFRELVPPSVNAPLGGKETYSYGRGVEFNTSSLVHFAYSRELTELDISQTSISYAAGSKEDGLVLHVKVE